MTRDDALCGPGASLDGTELSMVGNQPQEGGRRAQIPPTKIKMAYTPVPTRPNTPGIQKLPTGRFSAPFSRRAHGGMIMVIIEELWWGVGCPVRPGRVGTVEERAVGGWRACLERHVSPTTKHDHLPRVPPPHYWSIVCNGETRFCSLARELSPHESRRARPLRRTQTHHDRTPRGSAHVQPRRVWLCHRTGALLPRSQSHTRVHADTPNSAHPFIR